jgi:hypothetical protein
MKNGWIRACLVGLLGVLTTTAWALIIWTALHVSTIVLETLEMIVELAAMS